MEEDGGQSRLLVKASTGEDRIDLPWVRPMPRTRLLFDAAGTLLMLWGEDRLAC